MKRRVIDFPPAFPAASIFLPRVARAVSDDSSPTPDALDATGLDLGESIRLLPLVSYSP